MDRIVEVKVNGSHVWKDSQHAGTQGEVNATSLRIEFDDGWDGFAKTITWWDAKGENPTSRVLTAAELEDIKASTRIYLTPIVPEALAIWGKCMFSIDGYINGRRQKSAYASMVVKPCGNGKDITIEVPTPSKIEQLQVQIDVIIDTIHDAVEAKEAAEEARGKAVGAYFEAKTSELNAQAWAEGGFLYAHNGEVAPVDPVVGAKGYADQARAYVEGGRVQLSTGPAVYPPYSNGAKGEADRAKAYAEGGTYLEWVYDEETRGWKQVEVTVKGVKEYAEQRANIIDVTRLPSPSYSAEELPNLTAWAETENAGEYSWSAYDDDAPIPEGYYTIKAPDGKLYAFSIPNRSILGDDEFSVHQVDLFWNSADGISGTETFEYYEYDRRNDVHRRRTIMSELQFSEEKELNDNAFYRQNGDLYYYDPSAAKRLATEDDVRQLSEEMANQSGGAGKIDLTKYGITAADYEAPFTAEMYEVAHANGLGFQKAIDDAKAAGQRGIIIPKGNYPLCWAGGESEANPVIVSEGVDIYGNDSRLYVIFDEDGINPYFTGTNPHTLSGTVIVTDSSVYDLNIEGERQYRVTSPGWKDHSCGIGLTGNCHNNVIQNCHIKHISGDGIGFHQLGIQLATWTDTFTSLEWNGSAYVASKKMYRSDRHGVSFIPDMSAPHFINSTPNFMWSTEPFIIRCFNGESADNLGDMIGVIRVHGMQYFYFPEGTTYWFIELTREAEHAENATESWKFFLRQGYYSGTKVIGCELCYNQRGGMSNLPDSAVIRNCRVHNNGNPVNGMAAYYDSTRFGLDQEEVVIGSLTIEDSLFYGTNVGVYYKSWSIMLKNSKFYGDINGVCSLNGAVDFMAINCDFVSDHPIYGGACILHGAADFGEKTMIGCRVVGRISDSITVFGGDMSKAKPVYEDSSGNYVASENYVWIGNDGEIPSGGGGIDVTGANVGQIIQIAAVDENGVPTKWKPVNMPSGGACGESSAWKQVAQIQTTEDLVSLSVTEDMDGNPLSFTEAIIALTVAKASDATANGDCVISVFPSWTNSFAGKGINGLTAMSDAYCYIGHAVLHDGWAMLEVEAGVRTANSLSDSTWAENRIYFSSFGGKLSNQFARITRRVTSDLINDEGKLKGVTVGVDLATATKMGAGTRLEVWVR